MFKAIVPWCLTMDYKPNMAAVQEMEDVPFDLTETDRENLAQGDEKFRPHTWDELKDIVGIYYLNRLPSVLLLRNRSKEWFSDIEAQAIRSDTLHSLDSADYWSLWIHNELRVEGALALAAFGRVDTRDRPSFRRQKSSALWEQSWFVNSVQWLALRDIARDRPSSHLAEDKDCCGRQGRIPNSRFSRIDWRICKEDLRRSHSRGRSAWW